MPKTAKVSKEKAANLLDQVQMTDELFVTEATSPQQAVESTKPVAQAAQAAQAPQPLPMPQAPEQAAEMSVAPAPAKINGFSALLDHLKSESLRHNQQAQARRHTRRFAA